MRPEILANDAVPPAPVLVHLCLEVPRQHPLLLVLLQGLLQPQIQSLLHPLDVLSRHVAGLHLHLRLLLA